MRRGLRDLHGLAIRVLAAFALVGVLLAIIDPALDANVFWIRGAPLPGPFVTILIVVFSISTLARGRKHSAALARGTALALGLLCLVDAGAFLHLVRTGAIRSPLLISSSLVFGLLLLTWAATGESSSVSAKSSGRRWTLLRLAGTGAAVCVLGVGATWLHIRTLGETDYRRPADAVVVLGCAVRADGSPSPALRDRTLTACALYREGWVRTLVLSGGHGPSAPISEPACMRTLALAAGVPAEAIVLDETGVNTEATLAAAADLAAQNDWRHVLFVSHDYHLARIQLAARRHGLQARTVPARETVAWPRKHLVVAREIAAFGWYFLRL